MATFETLSSNQRKAIAALLSAPNVPAAARKAKVGERTLHRWINEDPHFKAALYAAEGAAIDTATRRLVSLQDSAIGTLESIMTDGEAAPGVRVRAALGLLDNLMRLRELRNVEARLEALESALGNR
jgi:gamma-glutamyl:cysteine ligase YbdK (ATP-grasp superfamily)